jgi:hypothetical protein
VSVEKNEKSENAAQFHVSISRCWFIQGIFSVILIHLKGIFEKELYVVQEMRAQREFVFVVFSLFCESSKDLLARSLHFAAYHFSIRFSPLESTPD